MTILKALIEVNVAIIGFWGLILVFDLNSLYSLRQNVMNELLTELRSINKKDADMFISKAKSAETQELNSKPNGLFKERIKFLNDLMNNITTNIRHTIYFAAFVSFLLISSMVVNLIAMGKTTDFGLPDSYLFILFMLFFWGVTSIFIEILFLAPRGRKG